jgi:anaerobic magnesium-protoporphyrin IX monomethyl ester cyclase
LKEITLMHISKSHPRTVPAGILYIAAVLKRSGYQIDFRDYCIRSYEELNPLSILSYLQDSANVIGISCMSDSLPFVVCALRELKAKQPEKTVILGGAGPSGVADKILERFPFIDIVVVGEGEQTIVEVMECLTKGDKSDLRLVRGIYYRHGEEVIGNPPRERISNLDQLPFPLYESIPIERYPLINIVFSRGCPYLCTFCDVAPIWKRKNYRRSVDSVIDELKFLRDTYGKTNFEFTDETFVLRRDVTLDFCQRLRRDGIRVEWACTGRINLITKELLTEMASSGCKAIFYGIESGSDNVLDKIRKDFSIREALDVLHKTMDHMNAVASFIWGFPFESQEDLLRTMLSMIYVSQIGADVRLNRIVPFALTPLYKEYGDRLLWIEERNSSSAADPFQAIGYQKEVCDLIKELPEVFPEFYWFSTDWLKEKVRLVESLERHRHLVNWPVGLETVAERITAS